MKKVVIALFVAFSLLAAPVAQAYCAGNMSDNCEMTFHSKKQAKTEKQDDKKLAKAAHHCCCHQVFSMNNLVFTGPQNLSAVTAFILEQDAATSVVVGPPLKPPSLV